MADEDAGATRRIWRKLGEAAKEFGFQWRPTVIAFVSAAVLLGPFYVKADAYFDALSRIGGEAFSQAMRGYGITFIVVLRLGVPILVILLLRERLRDYGLSLGKMRSGLKFMGLFYAIYVPCFIILLLNDAFRDHYSGVADRYDTWPEFFGGQVAPIFAMMITVEFLYRGFLLFGMKKHYGPYAAVIIALIPYVFSHHDKPAIEAFGSFPVGLALSWLALKTESIWYGVALHGTIAIGFNMVLFALG